MKKNQIYVQYTVILDIGRYEVPKYIDLIIISKYWYSYFSCVSKDLCDLSKRGTTNRRETTLEIQKALAEEAECPNLDDEVCCNEKELISVSEAKSCSDIAEDGYRYAFSS